MSKDHVDSDGVSIREIQKYLYAAVDRVLAKLRARTAGWDRFEPLTVEYDEHDPEVENVLTRDRRLVKTNAAYQTGAIVRIQARVAQPAQGPRFRPFIAESGFNVACEHHGSLGISARYKAHRTDVGDPPDEFIDAIVNDVYGDLLNSREKAGL